MAKCSKCVPAMDRRSFLRFSMGAGAGVAAYGMPHAALAQQTKAESKKSPKDRKKTVICLWMGGGASHLDAFDPKPGNPNGGEFKAINCAGAPGMQVTELFPTVASQGKHLSLIRSVATNEGAHERGTSLMHIGMTPIPGLEIPPIGSVISYENGHKDFPLPHYIAMSPPAIPQGNAFGDEYLPFRLSNGREPIPNIRSMVGDARDRERAKLLLDQNKEWDALRKQAMVEKVEKAYVKSEDVMTTPLLKAFDLGQEKSEVRSRYQGRFATNCLLALRLAEAGVSFIEIGMGGYDTHDNNFPRLRGNYPQVDKGMGNLIKDLADRDLLKDVVVMWMSEFGRTPNINAGKGRDHWARSFTVAMAGGKLGGGRTYGSTGPNGMACIKPVSIKKLFATIYEAAGINTQGKKYNAGGRAVKYAYEQPIKELF